MINKQAFCLIAGNPERLDQEILDSAYPGKYPGTLESRSLVAIQVDQHARGRRSIELVLSRYGWTLRYASGLSGRAILWNSRDKNPSRALAFGQQWVAVNPELREFYVRRAELLDAERLGIDCESVHEAIKTRNY